ncbi:hypothetical protein K439DRAFT_1635846 [Ramaria rubella]|nr:hypothetical protein K439DRAFT_1635846 [Ramaria rubella]
MTNYLARARRTAPSLENQRPPVSETPTRFPRGGYPVFEGASDTKFDHNHMGNPRWNNA